MADIQLEAVTLQYQEELLKNVALEVQRGEVLVLCGPSGSGKSSLIKLIAGLIPEIYPAQVTGERMILGHDASDEERFPIHDIGMVFQNPKTQFFTQDVYSELAFPMENADVPRTQMLTRLAEVAEQLDLHRFLDKTMFQLSGGEKQLISFGAACTLSPTIFLLDEPSSNLDAKTTARIQEYLLLLKAQGHTIVIAEHRLTYLMALADRFLYLPDGIFWEKAELMAKSEDELQRLGLRTLKENPLRKVNHSVRTQPSTLSLVAQQLQYQYPKQRAGVTIRNLELTNQVVTGFVGNNGAGKSTLLQLLTGLLRPKKGRILFNHEVVKAKQLIKESFVVMQDVNLQLFFETVEKEIMMQAQQSNAEEVIEWLGLEPLLKRHPQSLSGGEKQRVAIATALLSGKKIVVFDEPTSGLDLKAMQEVSRLIQQLQAHQVLTLIISHDMEFIEATCQRVIELQAGQIVDDYWIEKA